MISCENDSSLVTSYWATAEFGWDDLSRLGPRSSGLMNFARLRRMKQMTKKMPMIRTRPRDQSDHHIIQSWRFFFSRLYIDSFHLYTYILRHFMYIYIFIRIYIYIHIYIEFKTYTRYIHLMLKIAGLLGQTRRLASLNDKLRDAYPC